ncbi:MAG: hypothetical protein K2J39_11575 [Ruminococcus sp.]|nr:hypothetical protein [Ruminococcus sp.]
MYERLQELCKQRGTTITAVCEKVTGNKGNLRTWKKDYMRSDWLDEVASLLETSTDYILGRTDNPDINMNNNIIIGHDNSGTSTVNGDMQSNNNAIVEIETIISKLTGASRYRAIADVLEVLEKYA